MFVIFNYPYSFNLFFNLFLSFLYSSSIFIINHPTLMSVCLYCLLCIYNSHYLLSLCIHLIDQEEFLIGVKPFLAINLFLTPILTLACVSSSEYSTHLSPCLWTVEIHADIQIIIEMLYLIQDFMISIHL